MNSFLNKHFFVLCCFCFLAITGGKSNGCTIPVFQYALQNWNSAIYRVEVNAGEELSAEETEIIEKLKSFVDNTNVKIDVKSSDVKEPWLSVYFPTGNIVWKALSLETAEVLLDSPARREMARRLIRGDAAVWILIESGDKAKDDLAEETLQKHLNRLENEITLESNSVEDDPKDDPSMQVDSIDVKFSMIRISREDKKEEFFIASLLKSEEDLTDFDEPIAYPVFGKAIAIYALVGKGISGVNIERACRFMAGPCSCVLKAENPGTDLLVSADWGEAVVEEPLIQEIELPELTSITDGNSLNSDVNSNNDYEVILLSDNIEEETKSNDSKLIVNTAIFFIGAIVLLGVVTIVTQAKRKK